MRNLEAQSHLPLGEEEEGGQEGGAGGAEEGNQGGAAGCGSLSQGGKPCTQGMFHPHIHLHQQLQPHLQQHTDLRCLLSGQCAREGAGGAGEEGRAGWGAGGAQGELIY